MPDESAPPRSRPHLPFLDGIRALAALYVVIHHASTNQRFPEGRTIGAFFDYGHFAVDVFIVLSGFSLMLPVALFGELKGGSRRFLVRRALRIVPPYLFALLLSAALGLTILSQRTGTVWDVALPVSRRAVLAHLTLTQDLFPALAHAINYPLWSVSVESHIYLLFPLIVGLFARFRGWVVTAGALALGYAAQILLAPMPISTDGNGMSPYYVGLFTLGCLAARTSVLHKERVRWLSFAAVVAALVGHLVAGRLWWHHYRTTLPEQASSLFVGVAAAAAMLALSSDEWVPLRRALSWRPLAWTGGFAYSIYLVHAPILQAVWQYAVHPLGLGDRREPLVLVLVATPVVVGLSWLFSLAFERPFIPRSPAAERLAAAP